MSRIRRFASVLVSFVALGMFIAPRCARADDWAPIPPEDLALNDNPASPGADAMILYRESSVSAKGLRVSGDEDEEYFRIKIFTQAGVKYGDINIPWLKAEDDVKDVRGRTIHPDGTVVPFQGKVLEKEIVEVSGYKYLAKTFSLPDVQPGSIIEYKYRVQSNPGWLHSEHWEVSQNLFTREAHFIYVPYDGFTGFIPYSRSYNMPAEAKVECRIDGQCSLVAHNIPAVVDEPYMPPRNGMLSRVEFNYQDVGEPRGEKVGDYWSGMSKKWNGELDRFAGKNGVKDEQLSKQIMPGDTPEVKLRKIATRVQMIRNLDREESRSESEQKQEDLKKTPTAADVLRNGYGHSRDINFTFVALVRGLGLDATETFIAPRNDHLFAPEEEESRELSDDIVFVHTDGKDYYLDPAAKTSPFGLLPWYELEAGGIRVGKQMALVTTPNPVSSDATIVRHADLQMDSDGMVSGKLQVDFTGQESAVRREEYFQDDETGREKGLADEIKSWLPVGSTFDITTLNDWDDADKPIHVEGSVTLPGSSSLEVRRVLLPMQIFEDQRVQAFQAQKRVNNIYFDYPFEEIDDLKIHVAKNFKAALPPPPTPTPGAITYQISATQQGDTVEVNRHFVVKGILFSKDAYPAIRAVFGYVRTHDNAQILFEYAQDAKSN